MTQAPPAASGLLSRALADARSPRVPRTVPYLPERAFPWGEPGLHPAGAGGGVDLDRVLRLSLAAPRNAGGRLRPVASAGGLHPVRAHLLVGPGCSLPPGRYAYDPRAHRAHPRGRAPADAPPGAVVVLTVTAARTVAHYGHRAWPLLLLDAGHAAAAVALAAAPADVRVSLDADGEDLAAAAGLPRAADQQTRWPGVEPELPLAALWLPSADGVVPSPAPLTAWAALPCAVAPLPHPGADNAPPRELAASRHLLTYLVAGTDATWHPAARPTPVTDETLRTRRSAAPSDLAHPPAPDLLARVLATAEGARPDGPDWAAAVGGDAPGLLTTAGLLASGDARPTLAQWAAGQRWIGTAGAVLLAHGCPADAPPSLIRRSHLAAGYAAGIAQAHATALGLRSRPIGSWLQADLGAALGDAPGHDWIVHGLALAGPSDPPLPAPPPLPGKEERP
ncbi:nitroreductase [Streptomyces cyaneofuscatus]|uniref:Nitroreductase n=1 Tax=Streptomyces cyaneofuscatus TaxID=66883 RepID=A0ABZ1F6I5_9ACTN|nr:nitroreductase [Streptomyces cyaneofuscatus]WSB11956.1 nitroreductase [Streptomyces cyaneofuscatus]WSD44511.1 nitroreductase [Streptomyces cyaneofuscatus]